MVEAKTYEGPGAPVEIPEGCILGIGNPLLDVSAVVPNEIFEKYGVKPNDAILAEEKQMPLYEELVKDFDVDYIAGGATQNAIRVAQWMSQSKGATGFIGSIGQDDFGKQLTKACTDAGVAAHYFETSEQPTGVCAVLIHDKEKERSLVTKLDAANCYKHSHTESDAVKAVIDKAKIIYIASFFLTVPEGPATIDLVAKQSAEQSKIFAMNLSAPFLIDFFSEQMNKALPYTDFVFANETEAETFAKKQGWDCDLAEAALRLSAMSKVSGARPRTVVFSQGSEATIVAFNGEVTYYPVPKLNSDLLVDTNGAGDAFVGGFLARLAAGMPMAECVRAGHYAARVVIQRSGCSVPPQPDI